MTFKQLKNVTWKWEKRKFTQFDHLGLLRKIVLTLNISTWGIINMILNNIVDILVDTYKVYY